MTFRSIAGSLLVVSLAVLGTGCVSQSEVDKWRTRALAADETVIDLRSQLDEKEQELALLRGVANPNDALQQRINALLRERDALAQALAEAEEKLRTAAVQPLPADLTSELEALAAANPDLMTFNPNTGMIRFRSDVTFALGSATVRDSAIRLLGQLASVLNSPAAAPYEVRVVGHTDNVPMANAANKQKFEDNWGLSAFRAIGVMRVLNKAGVSPSRMSVAGYGEYQPVAPNGQRGSEANRRVEIYLVPMARNNEEPAPAPSSPQGSGAVVPMDPPPAQPESPAMFK